MVLVIPERTIDAWTAAEVVAVDALARIWAPDQVAQSATEPWDFAVAPARSSEKVLVLENKALNSNPAQTRVPIDIDQLLVLVGLQLMFRWPAYVGLPTISIQEVRLIAPGFPLQRALLRHIPRPFGEWHHIFRPLDVALIPQVFRAIQRGQLSTEVPTGALVGGRPLRRFLRDVTCCTDGEIVQGSAREPLPRWILTTEFARRVRAIISQLPDGGSLERYLMAHSGEALEREVPDAQVGEPLLTEQWIVIA